MRLSISRWIFFLFATVTAFSCSCQQVTFSEHIAPVIYKACSGCHSKGEIAPFTLENYVEVKHNAKMIRYTVGTHYMPPWRADLKYSEFHNERKVDSNFLNLFTRWMEEGYPEGKPGKVYSSNIVEKNELRPDFIIKMPSVYPLHVTTEDVFISFTDSIMFKEERYIKSIKILAGNKRLVHHCRVDFDSTNRFSKLMEKDGYVETYKLDGIPFPSYPFVGDYVPGISAYSYPRATGYKVSKKIYAIVNIHYSPNAREDVDSTQVYVYLYPRGYKPREVAHGTVTIRESGSDNPNLKVKADSISLMRLSDIPLDTDISLIAIQPHMHLLGKSIRVYGVTPRADTIPILFISDWDFNWQENYYFKNFVVLPKGSVMIAEAVYDNTSRNPKNPFNPPRDIYFNGGMNTANEMLEFYLQWVIYKPGDENLKLYN